MGNDKSKYAEGTLQSDFNPRSRVGNDRFLFQNGNIPPPISIHVPAWGTTVRVEALRRGLHISIHVPAWGTTREQMDYSRIPEISIHVPAWGTTDVKDFIDMITDISIHVPAWGTTEVLTLFSCFRKFQSTFPRGERRTRNFVTVQPFTFQSTFPRGERPQAPFHTI